MNSRSTVGGDGSGRGGGGDCIHLVHFMSIKLMYSIVAMENYIPLFSYLIVHFFSAANLVKLFQNKILKCLKIPFCHFQKKRTLQARHRILGYLFLLNGSKREFE